MKALHKGFPNVIVSTISIDFMSWDGTEREEFELILVICK